jgi:beta-glucosidase
MSRISPLAACLLVLQPLLGCTPRSQTLPRPPEGQQSWGSAWIARSGSWPSEACTSRARGLLASMTLAEKVGQMTQAEREKLQPGEIASYALGSVLSGGGSAPGNASAAEWADMLDAMHAEARGTRLGIPLLYGVDAVHGHGNVVGAVVFPHNIGLGCTRNPELVRAVARATALEVAATGVDWTFAPVVSPGRDERWGRTYETFSELPEEAGVLGAAAVRGYQGDRLGGEPTSILACAKHFAGDGATSYGSSKRPQALLDQGDTRLPRDAFEQIAIAPFVPAIAAGVGSVMLSFSSVDGMKLHGHRELISDVLKGRLGFKGLVVTDWEAINQLPGSYAEQVVQGVNAGIDLFMEPERWRDFIAALTEAVQQQRVPIARIDDAVTRILTVKCEAGLFEKGPVDRRLTARVGSAEQRELARRAVRESLVLLKNDAGLLPLAKSARIVLAGVGADSLTRQAGGWTVEWQGAEGKPFLGTTLLHALRAQAADPALVSFSSTGETGQADVAVLVMSEPPYAEWKGDSATLEPSREDIAALDRLHAAGKPVVVVLLSGRPLIIEPHLAKAAAWLAAWLPGSAGEGVADVIYGAHAPNGKLSHSWPRRVGDLPLNHGDAKYDPLFSYGHGLSYQAAPKP